MGFVSDFIGEITGANAAKSAARSQERALQQQTQQAQAPAAEAARQSSVQTAQAVSRQHASEEVERMQEADAASSKRPETSVGTSSETTTRKRARFQAPGSQAPSSISI